MKKIPKFVVVEGVDGSGKTTLVERFREEGSFKTMRTPTRDFAPLREEMDNDRVSLDSRYSYFLATTMHASEKVEEELERLMGESKDEDKKMSKEGIVMDRYVSSTIVYHQLRAEDNDLDRDYHDITSRFDILKPDLVLLLSGDVEQIAERVVSERPECENPLEDKVEDLERVDAKYKEVVGGYNAQVEEIDVTSQSKEETFELALGYVNDLDDQLLTFKNY